MCYFERYSLEIYLVFLDVAVFHVPSIIGSLDLVNVQTAMYYWNYILFNSLFRPFYEVFLMLRYKNCL